MTIPKYADDHPVSLESKTEQTLHLPRVIDPEGSKLPPLGTLVLDRHAEIHIPYAEYRRRYEGILRRWIEQRKIKVRGVVIPPAGESY